MIQRAMANGTSIESIPPAETTSGPSRGDVWVNGLWFISLTLSLSTALFAVLARQWFHQYTAIPSGSFRDRALTRQYRSEGLTEWRVLVLISLLPVLLHIALGLFLVGLVVFLMPLNPAIAWTVAGITFLVYIIYMICNILPLVNPQCPYRTPFSDILHVISRRLVPSLSTSLWSSILHPLQVARQLATLFGLLGCIIRWATSHCIFAIASLFSKQPEQPSSTPGARTPLKPWRPLNEIERQTANTEEIGARAIMWLLKSTSSLPTTSIVLQSLGGSSPAMIQMLHDLVLPYRTVEFLDAAISQILRSDPGQEISSKSRRLERLLRSYTSINPRGNMHHHYWYLYPSDNAVSRSWIENIVSSDVSLYVKAGLLVKPYTYILDRGARLTFPLKEAIFLQIVEPQTDTLLLPQDLWKSLQKTGLSESLYFLEVSREMLVKLYCTAFASVPASYMVLYGEFRVERTSAPRDFIRELAMDCAYRQVSLQNLPSFPLNLILLLCPDSTKSMGPGNGPSRQTSKPSFSSAMTFRHLACLRMSIQTTGPRSGTSPSQDVETLLALMKP